MRLLVPMPGCGMSPSPAISFDVSTTMTRLVSSVESTRALSRSSVVFPTPGRPRRRTLFPDSTTSRRMSTVPDGGYAVQGALDARAVVLGEGADAMNYIVEVFAGDRRFAEINGAARKASFGLAPEVHDHFDQVLQIRLTIQRLADGRRHNAQKYIKIVG